MARKKELSTKKKTLIRDNATRGTWKDLKRQAIALGMPFPDACGKGVFELIAYINRPDNPEPNPELINEYDKWLSKHLTEIGVPEDDPIRDHRLRLGYIGDEDSEGNVTKRKRVPGIKKYKFRKKKERDSFNLVKGTKKSYTWELASKGFSLERTIRRVTKKFPDAVEKSIRLWYRACLRKMKKQNGED